MSPDRGNPGGPEAHPRPQGGPPAVAVPGRHRMPARRRPRRVALAIVLGLVAVSPVIQSLPSGLISAVNPLAHASAAPGLTSGSVRIAGSGFGHGVGMSQYGARGQAAAGRSVVQILQHYYTGVTVTGYPDRRDLAVNVVHGGTRITLTTTALAAGGGRFVLQPVAGGAGLTAEAGDTVTLTSAAGGVAAVLRQAGGGTASLTAASLRIRWEGTRALAGPATTLNVASTGSGGTKSRRYRWGSLVVTPVALSRAQVAHRRLEAVAVVDLHSEYLRGIGEVPSSWPEQALMAQVVAARNYALAALAAGTRASCGGCNLWDDTRSQVYSGWAKEAPRIGARWVAAVTGTQTSSTTGLTVLYHGSPITAYYSSSTGGHTRDAAEVWGNAVPYLRSVPDPWSVDPANNPSFAAWHRTVSVARVLDAFGLDDLATLRVIARDDAGAATKVTARSSSGRSVTHSGAWVRRTFGLPADWITGFTLISPTPAPGPSGSPPPSVPGGSTPASSVRPPHSLVPAGLSPVYSTPGARTAGGKSWRTSCVRMVSGGYRCVALAKGTRYVRNAQGLWGPVAAWVQQRVSYFDRANSAIWRGNPRATPGRHVAGGKTLQTSCTPARATGHRTCWTSVLTSQVDRRPRAGGGNLYYRHWVWVRESVAYLT